MCLPHANSNARKMGWYSGESGQFMKTLLANSPGRVTTDHFANALDQDRCVVADFAGDVMMILPDLVRRVAPSVLLSARATFRAGVF